MIIGVTNLMTTPKPQTIAADISRMISDMALNAGTVERARELSVQILDDLNKLQGVDVVEASLQKANVFALLHDPESVEKWLKNAEQNKAPYESVLYSRELSYFLMGYMSRALPLFKESVRLGGGGKRETLFRKALATGWFKTTDYMLDNWGNEIADANLVQKCRKASQMMDEIGLTEELSARIMDHVHEMLNERNLIWLDSAPLLSVSDPSMIHLTYRVATPPAQAAEMTWNLACRLAGADLDRRGLMVTYRGAVLKPSPLAELATA